MGKGYVAVLDIGKTHAKLLLADPLSGEAAWSVQRSRTPLTATSPWQLDLEETSTWLLDALATAPGRERITDIVPVGHGAAAALIDAGGKLLAAPDYEDPVFESVATPYRAERDPFAQSLSPGLPLGLNLGRQLYFLQTREPSLFNAAAHLLLHPQYWAWRLSGVLASEVTSLGCHTDLWLPRAAAPAPLAQRRGWDQLLPPLRRADAVLGPIDATLAARTGLPAGVRVRCGIHDSNASWLAHVGDAATMDAVSVISSGTWTILMARGTDLARLDEARDMLANVDAHGTPIATARFMGGREFAAIASERPAAATVQDVRRILEHGAMALPSFADAGGAFAAHRAQLKDAQELTAPQRTALATTYMALMCDLRLDELGASGPVIVDGPLAGDALFGSLLARLRPRSPIHAAAARTGTLRGALMLAHAAPPPDAIAPAASVPLEAPELDAYRARWRAGCRELRARP